MANNLPNQRMEQGDVVDTFNTYVKYQEKALKAVQTRRTKNLAIFGLAYSLFALVIVGSFVMKDGVVFRGTNAYQQKNKLAALESQVVDINKAIAELNKRFESNTTDLGVISINTRIANLERKQGSIEETILVDPDKAITTRLLREKQDVLSQQLSEIKETYIRLSDKLDNFIILIIATPIVAALGWFIKYQFTKNKSSE